MPNQPQVLKFGIFEVDLQAGEVRKAGMKQKLAGQPFQVLQALLERPHEIVTREELRERLWPGNTFVDYDLALKKAVNRLREVLGDSAESPHFIETIPRRGYRFLGTLDAAEQPNAVPAATLPPTRRRIPGALTAGLVLALIAVLLIGLNVDKLRTRIFAKSRSLEIRSIAVLPLQNLSNDPSQDYFSDGITDALTTELAQIGALRVISRTSADHFKGTRETLPEIGRKLNVEAIVEGSVTRSENRVRITAQLIDVQTDRHLWARSYERDIQDILGLQAEVSRDIASEVKIKLTPQDQARLSNARSIAPETYEAYLKGRYYLEKLSISGFKEGLGYYQQAVTRDPNYAPAYVGLAECYEALGMWGALPPREARSQAKTAAEKALALDDTLGEAHGALGHIHFTYDWDWPDAEREFKRALELDPSTSITRVRYATYLSAMGRHDEALAQIKEAHALDPVSHITNGLMGAVYFWARRFDEAIDQFNKTLVLYPDSAADHGYLALSYEQKRMYGEAVKEHLKQKELNGVSKEELSVLRQAFASSGMKGFLRADLRSTIATSKPQYLTAWDFAQLYARLGENDQAFEWLEKSYQERGHYFAFMKVDPSFDGLHSDPRFQELLHRMNFPADSTRTSAGHN
jgi:TolB-like protein/DNA-binding winged helix-turn-helix (wHTH) protein/Flp pilus assembly protein TadD